MTNRRKIKAARVWLFQDDGMFRLAIQTPKGAYVDIVFKIDAADAMCAINRLAPVVASEIRAERSKHERYRTRLSEAWALTDGAIKGTTPTGGAS